MSRLHDNRSLVEKIDDYDATADSQAAAIAALQVLSYGTHDGTNVKVTVTNTIKYQVLAWA